MTNLPFYISLFFWISVCLAGYFFYRASGRSLVWLIAASAWILLQSLLSRNGFYADPARPARFLLLAMPPILFGLLYAATPRGKRFFSGLDIRQLTQLHTVRVLVEIVLFWLFIHHAVPRAMTFEGKNFDILTGLSAPLIYYIGFVRKTLSTRLMIAWNWIGIALLLVVVSIGVSTAIIAGNRTGSAHSPFAILQFPWALLPGFLVPTVFFAHFATLRRLSAKK